MSRSSVQRALGVNLLLLVIGAMAGCTSYVDSTPRLELDAPPLSASHNVAPASLTDLSLPIAATDAAGSPIIVHGQVTPRLAPLSTAGLGTQPLNGGYVLNFDNADIRDVLKAVLGDMLQIDYSVDPAVQGNITLRTAKGVPYTTVLPLFEDALKAAGIALVPQGSGFAAVPMLGAAKRARLALRGNGRENAGYRVEIVPLQFVAASELQHLLDPIVNPDTIVQVDVARNSIVLAGTDSELGRIDEMISMFDVDWLRGQSFGLFPLQYSQAKTIASDLESVIGGEGPMSGLIRIVPIEHLNALLVVSPRSAYVEEMRVWIERFDRGRNAGQPRLFVYRVQNGRAADLAGVLMRALSSHGGAPNDTSGGPSGPTNLDMPIAGAGATPAPLPASSSNPLLGGVTPGADASASPLGDIHVTADDANNALLIVTTPDKFSLVEAALRQLDTVPLQVLLEACVAEVHLTRSLQYGLQYYFANGHFSTLVSSVAPGSIGLTPGGLSLAFLQGNDIQAALDLIASVATVKVISAPKLMVMNNHTASIDVGDQVPVATSSAVGVTTANAPIVNTIQQLDTGIILHVTPRVNSGGLVLMDVNQEVSSTVPTTSSNINSPTIQQRKVSSSIAVADGQTIAIGGLISDTRMRSHTGIPWLMDLPYVGNLFSVKSDSVDRTELIVLMTAHVIRDQLGAEAATNELREKLPLIRDIGNANTQ
jgi:general secretion pathway protein D